MQNALIREYSQKVYDALQSQFQHAIDLVQSHGVQYARSRYDEHLINTQIGPVVKELWTSAAIIAAKQFEVKAAAWPLSMLGSASDFINRVLEYLSKFLLQKVVLPISKTTSAQIESILNEAMIQGWGVEKTVRELADTPLTKYRARMIVRTESVRAMNYSQLTAADDQNYQVEKQWIAIEDARTRHSHSEIDGQRTDLYEQFGNGLQFPGDPEGPPEETINCRCTLGYFAKRTLDGQLVPKRPQDIDLASQFNLRKVG